jgi:signal transduction histidine kinase
MAMKLRTTVAVTSLLVALPAAALVTLAIERWRARDLNLALTRVVLAQLNEQLRQRCESDANWFFTGPLSGRPRPGDPAPADEALAPRARASEQPYELFAFDEDFTGSSTAAPRFPTEFRHALRQAGGHVVGPFETREGTGAQIGVWTGWIPGPCAVLLGRMRPPPGQTASRVKLFAGLTGMFFLVAIAALAPTVRRVRRLARDAQASARQEFGSIAPDAKKKDEIGAITFAYNDAAKELHLRREAIADRDDALRRFLAGADDRIAQPLGAAVDRLGDLVRSSGQGGPARGGLDRAFQDVLEISGRLQNLIAAWRLRGRGEPLGTERVDLSALVAAVTERFQHAAHSAGVTLKASTPAAPVTVTGDTPLLGQALGNLLDNAIRNNRPGGNVDVMLAAADGPGQFSLRVSNTGSVIPDEQFKGLTAIRRFRGDEDRSRQPGVPGLGLAVARETAERSGFTMELRRPEGGGLEVEWRGREFSG